MSMTIRKISLLCILITQGIIRISGESTVLIDCLGAGEERGTTKLICTRDEPKPSVIGWVRPDRSHVAWCNQTTSVCWSEVKFDRHYTASVTSSVEMQLVIKPFSSNTDVGTWLCIDELSSERSECNKTSGYGTTIIDCLESDIEGMRTTLACTITEGRLAVGILWTSPDGSEVVTCDVQNKACSTSRPFVGRYKGIVEKPSQSMLVIESFNPDRDAGKWSCSDGRRGPKSSCQKKVKYISLEIAGLSIYAELRSRYVFTCTISNASHIDDQVAFYRDNFKIGSLYQEGDLCRDDGDTSSENYQVRCGVNTNDELSDTKTYTLTIKETSLRDENDWWCNLKLHRKRSNKFKLTLHKSTAERSVMNPAAIGAISVTIIVGILFVVGYGLYRRSKRPKKPETKCTDETKKDDVVNGVHASSTASHYLEGFTYYGSYGRSEPAPPGPANPLQDGLHASPEPTDPAVREEYDPAKPEQNYLPSMEI